MTDPPLALVYHAGGLGDFVLSLPAIQRLTQAYPRARWAYWGPAGRLALLPGFDPPPSSLLRKGHTLWGESPDPDAVEALRACAAVLAFGGRASPPWTRLPGVRALAIESFPSAEPIWVPVHQLRQLDGLGMARLRRPWLPTWRTSVLSDPDPSEIVIHPGSGDPKKNLAAGIWQKTLKALSDRLGLPIRLALGPAEEERGGWDALTKLAVGAEICTDLRSLLRVLSRARLYLGNDSGPTHLASLLAIPTVAVFGPSDPTVWRPLGPKVRIVTAAAECAPCNAGSPIACNQPSCLERVDPDLLVEVALELACRTPNQE